MRVSVLLYVLVFVFACVFMFVCLFRARFVWCVVCVLFGCVIVCLSA